MSLFESDDYMGLCMLHVDNDENPVPQASSAVDLPPDASMHIRGKLC
jgi:hypothetical protein